MVSCVIFDLDGLLFDSEKTVFEIYRDIAKEEGMDLLETVFADLFAGKSGGENCERLSRMLGGSLSAEEIRRRFSEAERKRTLKGIPLKKGARELLCHLRDRGIRAGIASSGERERAGILLENAGIGHLFSFSVYGDETSSAKPYPGIFLRALELSGCSREETVILEDSGTGIEAACRAGIPVICVPDMKVPPEAVKAYCMAGDLLEVMDIIDTMA